VSASRTTRTRAEICARSASKVGRPRHGTARRWNLGPDQTARPPRRASGRLPGRFRCVAPRPREGSECGRGTGVAGQTPRQECPRGDTLHTHTSPALTLTRQSRERHRLQGAAGWAAPEPTA
jgi:hypothetical protein